VNLARLVKETNPMMRLSTLLLVALAVTGVEDPPQPPQPTRAQIDAMLAKTRPGPEHAELAPLVGRWSQEISWRMGPKPIKATGTATNRLILGGRFLASERIADNPAGAAIGVPSVEALSLYGFDRRLGRYTILELDSMGTYWVSAAGSMGPDRTIVMSGETLDGPQAEPRRFDMLLKLVDADTYVTRIVFKSAGQPERTLVETVSRRLP
jgi:hypothetical protein